MGINLRTPVVFDSLADAINYGEVLVDPVKVEILTALSRSPMDKRSIAAMMNKPITTISYHLGQLLEKGIVKEELSGRVKLYQAVVPVFIRDKEIDKESNVLIDKIANRMVTSFVEEARDQEEIMKNLAERCAGGGYSTDRIKEYLLVNVAYKAISQLVTGSAEYTEAFAEAVMSVLKSAERNKLLADLLGTNQETKF